MNDYERAAVQKAEIAEKIRQIQRLEESKGQDCCSSPVRRESVLDVLDQRLSDLRLQVNQLDALRRQLPQEMSLPAQEALINLIRHTRG